MALGQFRLARSGVVPMQMASSSVISLVFAPVGVRAFYFAFAVETRVLLEAGTRARGV
jgi:hypothetical protein